MRFINTMGYNPKWWFPLSQTKRRELIQHELVGQEKVFLNAPGNKIWNQLKSDFERMSHNKCWFTEAYASVSDFHIEHFRPQKGVDLIRNKDPYPERRTVACNKGYWWLAYEITNFKLAASKPNQLKGNYFPLETNSSIAKPIDNSWMKEVPMLVDPCIKSDTELISFDGIQPTPSNPVTTSVEHIRARISIEIYGLRHRKLKIARSRILGEVKNYFSSANTTWDAMEDYKGLYPEIDAYFQNEFQKAVTNIVMMLRPDREFTKMVLSFLKAANKAWVETYVLDVARMRKYI